MSLLGVTGQQISKRAILSLLLVVKQEGEADFPFALRMVMERRRRFKRT